MSSTRELNSIDFLGAVIGPSIRIIFFCLDKLIQSCFTAFSLFFLLFCHCFKVEPITRICGLTSALFCLITYVQCCSYDNSETPRIVLLNLSYVDVTQVNLFIIFPVA
jgi:hypothetical protein